MVRATPSFRDIARHTPASSCGPVPGVFRVSIEPCSANSANVDEAENAGAARASPPPA